MLFTNRAYTKQDIHDHESFRKSGFLYSALHSPIIVGDSGAVSWVDKMSVVKGYCKIETSPWELTLTKPVPEAFELPASDWPEKFFLANQRREAAG